MNAPAGPPPFEVIEHPADVGIRVYGRDLPELFAHAAQGMSALMTNIAAVVAREPWPVQVTAPDRDSLLVAWLSELLWLIETDGLLFRCFTIKSLSDTRLAAVARGEPADPARHPHYTSIKAVTYHQLAIRPQHDGWATNIIFDV